MRYSAQRGAVFLAVPQLVGFGLRHQCLDQRIVNRSVYQVARGRDARLAGRSELRRCGHLHHLLDIRITPHDHRRVAAQLEDGANQVWRGQRREFLAHVRGAGERHGLHHRRRQQLLADRARIAEDQVDDAFGQARIGQGLDNRIRGVRREFGCLQHHRATCGQRRTQLAPDQHGREIPGRDRHDNAQGRRQRQARAACDDALVHLAADAAGLFAVPGQRLYRAPQLADRVGLCLAGLQNQAVGDLLDAFRQQGRCLFQDRAACLACERTPRSECVACRIQRCLNLAGIGPRHDADGLSGGRIDVGLGTRFTFLPPTIDEEVRVKFVFGHGRLLEIEG
jgi:hypothetical protein